MADASLVNVRPSDMGPHEDIPFFAGAEQD
jgi:hypothetical protein